MAILIPKENIIDNTDDKFIGIKLPLDRSVGRDGYFTSTTLTIDAVKENIINLFNTRSGERVFHPTLGNRLDDFLFDQIDSETELIISDRINDMVDTWMPFITVRGMNIHSEDNSLSIKIEFILNKNPGKLESVQVDIR